MLSVGISEEMAYAEIERLLGDDDGLARVVEYLERLVDHYNWVGIYAVEGNELVLRAFVGEPTEHTRIPVGSGICGAAVEEAQTIIVQDVLSEPRYIVCSTETRSEMVVPIFKLGVPVAEIDIDSDAPNTFTQWDRDFLEKVAELLAPRF